jgi:hypothetical protein
VGVMLASRSYDRKKKRKSFRPRGRRNEEKVQLFYFLFNLIHSFTPRFTFVILSHTNLLGVSFRETHTRVVAPEKYRHDERGVNDFVTTQKR